MNRPIEYRCWDKVKNKMYDNNSVGFICGQPFINTGFVDFEWKSDDRMLEIVNSIIPIVERNRFVFIQFTGLFDKTKTKAVLHFL